MEKATTLLLVLILAAVVYTAVEIKNLNEEIALPAPLEIDPFGRDWMSEAKNGDGSPVETLGDLVDYIGCKVHDNMDKLDEILACACAEEEPPVAPSGDSSGGVS